ncbi:hypothetical protein [Candidatus Hodgkinia cicadicola]
MEVGDGDLDRCQFGWDPQVKFLIWCTPSLGVIIGGWLVGWS